MPDDYEIDPYSAFVADVSIAFKKAIANNGAMNTAEYNAVFLTMVELKRLDPHIAIDPNNP